MVNLGFHGLGVGATTFAKACRMHHKLPWQKSRTKITASCHDKADQVCNRPYLQSWRSGASSDWEAEVFTLICDFKSFHLGVPLILGSYFAKVLELDISGNNIGLEGAKAGLTMKTSNTGCTLQTCQMVWKQFELVICLCRIHIHDPACILATAHSEVLETSWNP